MKTIDEIKHKIDFNNDGIKLELNLFNQGKYDCDELRTVIKNVGIRLGITNTNSNKLTITNIYLGIETDNKNEYFFFSSSLLSKFPLDIAPNEKFCANYYGTNVRDKFAAHHHEKGFFILCIDKSNRYIFSSKFSGDQIEEFITELEDGDGDYANWGSSDFHNLDQQVDKI